MFNPATIENTKEGAWSQRLEPIPFATNMNIRGQVQQPFPFGQVLDSTRMPALFPLATSNPILSSTMIDDLDLPCEIEDTCSNGTQPRSDLRNQLLLGSLFRRSDMQGALQTSANDLEQLKQMEPAILSDSDSENYRLYNGSITYPETSSESSGPVFTLHQAERWQQRFNELVAFRKEYGHSCVPSYWPQNHALAQWVKRQRSQWRFKQVGKHSNMTDDRESALNSLNFVWDSHTVFWEERLNELVDFKRIYGHANVPTRFADNPQLAIWCKCQRRQFKLYSQKDPRSNMTPERIEKLAKVGFVFNPRGRGQACGARRANSS